MARDEKLEKLRGVPLFTGLGGRELERLGALTDEVRLPAGRVLMRQGDAGDELYIVLSGAVRVERDGEEVLRPDALEVFGEISLIDGGPRSATVTLTEDSSLLVVGRRDFHELLDEFPEIRLQLLDALAHRVRSAETHRAH